MGISDELERLQALHERGALTQQEYERAKARVLGEAEEGTGQHAPADSGASRAEAFFKQLARSRTDRFLGGVCGGLGRHTDLPSWAWRVIFCVVSLYFGSGILFYVLLWIFLPVEEQ